MAEKKLSPYQQARRGFVQARVQARGIEGSPEERKKIRQRFDVLAQTKEGRGKIARNVLPNAQPEERKNFRRMLSSELPTRSVTTPKTGTTTTPKTGSSYTQAQITQMRSVAGSVGPQLYQAGKPKEYTQTTTPTPKTQPVKKSNSLIQNIRAGLIATVPGLGNVAKARTEYDKGNIAGTLKQLAIGVPQTALAVAAFARTASPVPKGLPPGPLGMGTGGPIRPSAPGPRTSGPIRPSSPNRGPLQLGPGPKVGTTPKTSTTPKASATPKTTAKPAATKPAATKPAATKPAATKPAATKPAAKEKTPRMTKAQKEAAKDAEYGAAQAKNRFPGFKEGDAAFVEKLNRAQTAIEKNAPGAAQYNKWLKNPQTQATLRRLRNK
jgi:hypothetical protein